MAKPVSFVKLFEPFTIRDVKLRNRIVKPAQGMVFASDDGYVTERNRGYYETLAKGGVGLIIVEIACVDFPAGASGPAAGSTLRGSPPSSAPRRAAAYDLSWARVRPGAAS